VRVTVIFDVYIVQDLIPVRQRLHMARENVDEDVSPQRGKRKKKDVTSSLLF